MDTIGAHMYTAAGIPVYKDSKWSLEFLWHAFRANKVARNLALNVLIGFA